MVQLDDDILDSVDPPVPSPPAPFLSILEGNHHWVLSDADVDVVALLEEAPGN